MTSAEPRVAYVGREVSHSRWAKRRRAAKGASDAAEEGGAVVAAPSASTEDDTNARLKEALRRGSLYPATVDALALAATQQTLGQSNALIAQCNVFLEGWQERRLAQFDRRHLQFVEESSAAEQEAAALIARFEALLLDTEADLAEGSEGGVFDDAEDDLRDAGEQVSAKCHELAVGLTADAIRMGQPTIAEDAAPAARLFEQSISIHMLAKEVCTRQRTGLQQSSTALACSKNVELSGNSTRGPTVGADTRADTRRYVDAVLHAKSLTPKSNRVRLVFGGRAGYVHVHAVRTLELPGATRRSRPRRVVTDVAIWVPIGAFGLPPATAKAVAVSGLHALSSAAAIDDYAEQLRERLAPGTVVLELPIEHLCRPDRVDAELQPLLLNRSSVFHRSLCGSEYLHLQRDEQTRQRLVLEYGALARLLETWYVHVKHLEMWAFSTGGSGRTSGGEYVRMDESQLQNVYFEGKAEAFPGDPDKATTNSTTSSDTVGGLLKKLVKLHRCDYESLIAAVVDVTELITLGMRIVYRKALFPSKAARDRSDAAMEVVDSTHSAAYSQLCCRPAADDRGEVHFDPCGLVATRLSAAVAVWIQSTEGGCRSTWLGTLRDLEAALASSTSSLVPYTASRELEAVRHVTNTVDAAESAEADGRLQRSVDESKRRREAQRAERARRRGHAAQAAGATASCETVYDAPVGALVAHLLQTYVPNLGEDPIEQLSLVRTTFTVTDGVAAWVEQTEEALEKLMQVVDARELAVLAAGGTVNGLTDYTIEQRRAKFNDATVVRSSESACFASLPEEGARLIRDELPAAFAEIRRLHCAAMKGMSAEEFSSKTSRDPTTSAVVQVTSDAGYKATWQDRDLELGGNIAYFSMGYDTRERYPVAAIFAQYPSAVQLLAASGACSRLAICGHVKPTLMAKVEAPYGALVPLCRSKAWRTVGRAHDLVTELHHPGLLQVSRRIAAAFDFGGEGLDSASIIEYNAIGRVVDAKERHRDSNNEDYGPQTGFAQMHGQKNPYIVPRTLVMHDGHFVDINDWRCDKLVGPHASHDLPPRDGPFRPTDPPVKLASIDYLNIEHKVHSVRRESQFVTQPAWDCSTGEPPAEGCTVVVCQRKGKVDGAAHVASATIVIAEGIRRQFPVTAAAFGEPFLKLLETVKAVHRLPAQYKAARRDGLLPKTDPYSKRDWKARDYREERRREALDVDGEADDEDTGEADIYKLVDPVPDASLLTTDALDTAQLDRLLERHVLVPKVLDPAIDRFKATFARAAADCLGCPRPHHLHKESREYKQAYGASPAWVVANRVRELLPPTGRLCGRAVGQVVAAVGDAWKAYPPRWVACSLLVTHVDLEYPLRMLIRQRDSDARPDGQATTRAHLPEAFDPDHVAVLTRQVYAWRDETGRSLSSGRREPLQVGLLLLQIKELVLGLLRPPPLAASVLHAWLTAGHLAQSSDLRASLVLRFLFYAKVLVDDRSVLYTPRWKQGSTQFFRLLNAVRHKGQLDRVVGLLKRLRVLFGPAILRRLHARMNGPVSDPATDHGLSDYEYVFELTFGVAALSFEDVEAIACECKDAVLHAEGIRHRAYRTAHLESFCMVDMPVGVAHQDLRSFVRLDMSPTEILPSIAGHELARTNFHKYRTALLAELARLMQGSEPHP